MQIGMNEKKAMKKLMPTDWHNIMFVLSSAIKQIEGAISNENKDYRAQSMINYGNSLEDTLAKVKLVCLMKNRKKKLKSGEV